MKIVYCLNSIRYIGGIQMVTVVKANALAEIPGNEVYVVVTDNKDGECVHKLSPKVHLVDLDINYYYRDRERPVWVMMFIRSYKRRLHRKALNRFLDELNPDVVISVGQSEKYMVLSNKKRTWKVIREFHFEKNYRVKYAESLFQKYTGALSDFYEFNFVDRKYDRIVVLTQEDKDMNWQGWSNVEVMPNPVSFQCSTPSPLTDKTIVSMGRLHHVKNFSALIRAFGKVVEQHPDWKLQIYGKGDLENELTDQIRQSGLEKNVFLMGFTNDIKGVLCKSSIAAFSSLIEGFPLVLVETMECGVPPVTYQCPTGPKDIITDGKDGFLVPLNDEQMLAERICQLIEDKELRIRMGAAAKERAKYYQVDQIAQRWMKLFNEVINS